MTTSTTSPGRAPSTNRLLFESKRVKPLPPWTSFSMVTCMGKLLGIGGDDIHPLLPELLTCEIAAEDLGYLLGRTASGLFQQTAVLGSKTCAVLLLLCIEAEGEQLPE